MPSVAKYPIPSASQVAAGEQYALTPQISVPGGPFSTSGFGFSESAFSPAGQAAIPGLTKGVGTPQTSAQLPISLQQGTPQAAASQTPAATASTGSTGSSQQSYYEQLLNYLGQLGGGKQSSQAQLPNITDWSQTAFANA